MPQQLQSEIENNFTKGLITESTGLNFPENASTDTDNCEYTLIGDTLRRRGINQEVGGTSQFLDRTNLAISTYKWNNVSGDGSTQIVVEQVGSQLYFYQSSSATLAAPLSTTVLASAVNIRGFLAAGGSFDSTAECQYADGNGYLFVYHPSCDPFYCTYTAGVITGAPIFIQIRDFQGVVEGLAVTTRPGILSDAHLYNLANQGWSQGAAWAASSGTVYNPESGLTGGSHTFTVASGLAVTAGDAVSGIATFFYNEVVVTATYPNGDKFPPVYVYTNVPHTMYVNFAGNATAYATTTLTVNVVSISYSGDYNGSFAGLYAQQGNWTITPTNKGYIGTWNTGVGGYPSNADVWWYFKNTTGVFSPSTTLANVSLNTGNAPRGHYIINAFNQQRDIVSSIGTMTDTVTLKRPRTGTWFQGRVWYTGCDASTPALGTANANTWTESIYFSQIVQSPADFGSCYQTNDPTSQTLFGLLPSDGGVITIQGCGSIYKLFPMQNAMLIFAANGVWYMTGSAGIGFSASDYTIVKLSSIRSISSTSFVDVNGLPMFWNEEGIYSVESAKQGTSLLNTPLHVNPLEVIPATLGTILTFYQNIPLSSKKYARAAYDPVEYIVQWVYRDTEAADVTERYTYNKILNFNSSNKAFFPYTVDTSVSSINGIIYVTSPGGSTAPPANIKYVASTGRSVTFAEEYDPAYVDWGNINFTSHFVTGYKLRGQAIKKFQPQYIQVYCRTNGAYSAYKIQGMWDFSNSRSSGRWSAQQLVNNALTRYDTISRRHKLRGNGYALQFRFTSVDGQPFDIQGWSVVDTANQGT